MTARTERDARLRAALAYAARGWHVIPLRPTGTARDRKRPAFPACAQDTCQGRDPWCARAGRHVTWEERATTDPDRIRRAWMLAPFGVGIACGPSGLLVLDLDVPKPDAKPLPPQWRIPGVVDGADMLCVLAEQAGHPVPLDTRTVATPTGGAHLFYTAPPGLRLGNTAKHLAPLIDTRGWGGQVVAPPTTDNNGTPYTLTADAPLLEFPAWLQDRLPAAHDRTAPPQTPGGQAPGTSTGARRPAAPVRPAGRVDRIAAYVEKAIEGERARVAAVHGRDTTEGQARNHTLFTAAVALGQLVGGGHLTTDRARAVLLDAARPHLDVCTDCDRDAERTVTSGLNRGMQQPRTLHPKGHAA